MDLSYRAQIMSKDVAVATVAGNAVTPVREDLLPLFFKRSSSFEDWLRTRAIDIHRTNSRLLKKALRLAERDETELVLSVYAATITDTYWVKPEGSSLAYSDVKFTENYFDDVALTGGGVSEIALLYRNSEDKASMAHTPELTNTGSFEKCWRLIGGEWWMYKRADRLALFSELFVYELGTALGFPMAYYERVDGSTIRSRDFTGGAGVNFEPAASIVGDDDDYGVSYAAFRKLGTEFSDAYLEIIIEAEDDSFTVTALKKGEAWNSYVTQLWDEEKKKNRQKTPEEPKSTMQIAEEKVRSMSQEALKLQEPVDTYSFVCTPGLIKLEDKDFYRVSAYKKKENGTMIYECAYLVECASRKVSYKYNYVTEETELLE